MSEYTYEIKWAHELGLTQSNTSNALDCVDSISRQAAIDEMSKMYHAAEKWGQDAEDDTIKARAESCMATLVEMKLRVEKLPSAESQIVRCEECAYASDDDGDGWVLCQNSGVGMKKSGFCSDGERREDG